MAKKPPKKKPQQPKETPLKVSIREYLLDEGFLREQIRDPKLELGYRFQFPHGKDGLGKDVGRNFTVVKEKNKDSIKISHGFHFSPDVSKAFDSLDINNKNKFMANLTSIIFIKELTFSLEFSADKKVIVIHDGIFLGGKKQISKNLFYRTIKRIYGTTMYCIALINERLGGKISIEDLPIEKKIDPSLYA